eukprot:CAMPEP_0197630294 /NCGR_PEP_ID=MMETSP1338-20131121/7825_1 /TAXON_ID=43686 ORGANISM="Pelagodinium beii, Strain RCC1491" /NCGR_SAMPLE_ID=MMETSP1338 /ASSEMBLY_ACC=CAM_ASM_000754 /LENGTH=372 /DNA_ID=CAMNT_0043201483 /DNA_START=85 /DNA_END=1203 /DNA_ORIENTATION=-
MVRAAYSTRDVLRSKELGTAGESIASDARTTVSNDCGRLAKNYPAVFSEDATAKSTKIKDFTLMRCLGAGGMGEVWLASLESGQQVVVKFPTTSPRSLHMMRQDPYKDECTFARLASARAKASVANCISEGLLEDISYYDIILEAEATTSLPYAVFDLAPGTELEKFLQNSPETPAGALQNLAGVFEVLDNIYALMGKLKGPVDGVELYHDDLQPCNIMITDKGTVAALDYGFSMVCCDSPPVSLIPMPFSQECDLSNLPSTYPQHVYPCNIHSKEISQQKKFLAQNFISMLISFPQESGGLSDWYNGDLQQVPHDEQFQYVQQRFRAAYAKDWTSKCDDALRKALLPEGSSCDLSCLVEAYQAASASLASP